MTERAFGELGQNVTSSSARELRIKHTVKFFFWVYNFSRVLI